MDVPAGVADDGTFCYSTVRPVSYTVPDDGPAGDMLRALGRNAWRPAHLHMIINAPGHKPLITEFFPEDDKYLDGDAVFGVQKSLIREFKPDDNGELATTFDIVLDRV